MNGSNFHTASTKRKILLIDDNPADRYLIQSSFEESGISCEWSVITHGGEAILMSNSVRCQPDVILLDELLPGASGLEVLIAFKQSAIWASTPVVMLIGSCSPLYRKSAQEAGALDVINKPFGLDEWMRVPGHIEDFLAATA